MFNIKDVMNEYRVSKRTVYNWIEQGMPYLKVGKLVRFEPDKVKEWFISRDKK